MKHLGDFPTGATVDFKWNAQGADGASITRGTDGSIRIYKDNSVTQRTSANGITDTEDFDGLTGLNHLRIDLSDNTDAGFYAAGHEYQVVLQGAVIDGKAVNAVLAEFSIERAGGILAILKGGTLASASALSTTDGKVDAIKTKTDQLTFTVANQVRADVRYVNGVPVTGAGTSGNPWGPA